MDNPKLWKMLWFRKTLLFFFITVCIPTATISSVYLYTFSQELQSRFDHSLSLEADRLTDQLDALMQPVERLAWQLTLSSNLDNILLRTDRASMYDYLKLQTAMKDQITIGGYIHSIYIHFGVSGKVLTTEEGLYADPEFFDRAVITDNPSDGPYRIRTLSFDKYARPTTDENTVITYRQELPLSGQSKLGRMIVNIDPERLKTALLHIHNSSSEPFFLADARSGRVFLESGLDSSEQSARLLDNWKRNHSRSDYVSLEDGRYFAAYRTVNDSWLLVRLQSDASYQAELAAKVKSLVMTDLVILLIGFGFAYLFSFIVYSPWRSILKQYGSFFTPSSPKRIYDESALFGDGVKRLLAENGRIYEKMEQMAPLLRHKLVYDVLNGYAGTDAQLTSALHAQGIVFPERRFSVGIAAFDPGGLELKEEPESIKLLLFSLVETEFSRLFRTAGTWVEDGRFAFIFNIPAEVGDAEWRDSLEAVSQRMNGMLEERMGIALRFAFSRPIDSAGEVAQSYAAARRLLNYRALFHKAEILFESELEPGRHAAVFPASLQHLLVRSVLKGDRRGADEALDLLFDQYIEKGKFAPDTIQETMMILIGALMNELLKEGYELEDMSDIRFLQWNECGDKQELRSFLHTRIGRLIDRMHPHEPPRTGNEYVARTIEFIEQRYMEPITIADLASAVGLTPNYISRLFKQEIGIPPLDYLTRYRIKKAKEMMLMSRHLTLKEIGHLVGYPDVHSFIRFFKKYESVTPGTFRKLETENQ